MLIFPACGLLLCLSHDLKVLWFQRLDNTFWYRPMLNCDFKPYRITTHFWVYLWLYYFRSISCFIPSFPLASLCFYCHSDFKLYTKCVRKSGILYLLVTWVGISYFSGSLVSVNEVLVSV